MLILTRRIGEGVIIGDDIRVVVLEVRGKQFRLGIEAPTDVVVLRDEIFQRLTQENLQAADVLLNDLQALIRAMGDRIAASPPPVPAPTEVSRLAIDSDKLGPLEAQEDQIITFCQGLLGFGGPKRFVLLARPETSPFLLLQCVDQPDLALVVAEVSTLVGKLQLNRINSTLAELKAQSPEDLQVFAVLTIPPGRPGEATANLVSPILINPRRRLGKQVVLENTQYTHQHRLLPE